MILAQARALKKAKKPVPSYLSPPELTDGYMSWFNAFQELSTERKVEFGPIPNSSIRDFPTPAHEKDHFLRCIRAMDSAFLTVIRNKLKEAHQK